MLLPEYEELVGLKNHSGVTAPDAKIKVTANAVGGHASLFKGRGLDFSEFREYAPGDDIRAIDWRVTARTGRPHTKLFTEERERSVILVVDLNAYMNFGTRRTFKSIQAARAAALLAWRAHDRHDKTGAILFGRVPERIKVLAAKRSRKPIWEIFRTLCAPGDPAVPPRAVAIEEALDKANRTVLSGSSVFVLSDFFSPTSDFEMQLGLLSRRCEVTLIKVSDPADADIPKADEIRFSDPSGGELLVDTNDVRGAIVYRRQWTRNDAALSAIASKLRVKVIRLETTGDARTDLFRGAL